MKIQTRIGETLVNGFPPLSEIEHYFTDYSEEKWAYGGQSDGSLRIYGAHGTWNSDPFKDRINVTLCVIDDPNFGMYLYYAKHGGGYGDHYFSVGDMSRLTEFTRSRHDDPLSLGLFVSPSVAWLAVQDFITTTGERSPRVNWISGDDLPPEAFPES